MIEIPLTKGHVAVVDDEDAHLAAYYWQALRGCHTVYASRNLGRASGWFRVLMHREILGIPPGVDVDHRDGNGLNNLRSNLRVATRTQNNANAGLRCDNTSGFKGVGFCPHRCKSRPWLARIGVDKKHKAIGFFHTAEEAARAYDAAARAAFGEFAKLNFPEPIGGDDAVSAS